MVILKSQITKLPVKLYLRQYSALRLKRKKNTERILVVSNVILRLDSGKKEGEIILSLYTCIYIIVEA